MSIRINYCMCISALCVFIFILSIMNFILFKFMLVFYLQISIFFSLYELYSYTHYKHDLLSHRIKLKLPKSMNIYTKNNTNKRINLFLFIWPIKFYCDIKTNVIWPTHLWHKIWKRYKWNNCKFDRKSVPIKGLNFCKLSLHS